jgi:hypothetical protein
MSSTQRFYLLREFCYPHFCEPKYPNGQYQSEPPMTNPRRVSSAGSSCKLGEGIAFYEDMLVHMLMHKMFDNVTDQF